ncbi:methyl-accepting chemotaxis protein [Dongia sp.]|uniref:methyl-accepting chemotaxis protein n=1 Tax=Dongia sp. TaxID=1977262 RepID=UPI0035B30117
MRINEPVTDREIQMQDGDVLVTKTDTGGRITFVNQAFLRISGFTEEELIGQPHNIVRHPSMPKEAFADLWSTIKSGNAWEAPVKNRAKSGDYYWVRANATPIIENGTITGFISVRSKPSREEVAAAGKIYDAIRKGQQGNLTVEGGRVKQTGVKAGLIQAKQSIGLRVGATLGVLILCLLTMTIIGLVAPAETALYAMWTASSIGFAFASAMCLWLHAGIKSPLARLKQQLTAITRGELGRAVPDDPIVEFRDISNIVRAMKAQLSFATEEKAELDRHSVAQRNKVLREMADTVEAQVAGAVGNVAGFTENMSTNARQMAQAAHLVSENSQAVSAAATQMLANTQTVNGATDQLAASIREIAGQLEQTVTVSRATMASSESTRADIEKLSTAVDQISVITGVIRDVAAQTNLLALNATIEAARAGEAGKGFAVVANEVKNLAAQTANSTAEIERTVGEVRAATSASVISVNDIVQKIREVDSFATIIASAVEQQSAATSEIARNVGQATDAAKEVAERIIKVAEQAEATGGQATSVNSLAGDVDNSIHDLREAVVRAVRHVDASVNRRKNERYQLAIDVDVAAGSERRQARIIDLSAGGARFVWPADSNVKSGEMVTLTLPGLPPLRLLVKEANGEWLRGKFEIGAAELQGLQRFIEQAKDTRRAQKVA